MSIVTEPAVAGVSRGWTLLFPSWWRLAEASMTFAGDRKTAQAISELSRLDEHELNDMGLSRCDLTPEGLAVAGAHRSRQQAAIAAEFVAR